MDITQILLVLDACATAIRGKDLMLSNQINKIVIQHGANDPFQKYPQFGEFLKAQQAACEKLANDPNVMGIQSETAEEKHALMTLMEE